MFGFLFLFILKAFHHHCAYVNNDIGKPLLKPNLSFNDNATKFSLRMTQKRYFPSFVFIQKKSFSSLKFFFHLNWYIHLIKCHCITSMWKLPKCAMSCFSVHGTCYTNFRCVILFSNNRFSYSWCCYDCRQTKKKSSKSPSENELENESEKKKAKNTFVLPQSNYVI